jgi:hypothetical protein
MTGMADGVNDDTWQVGDSFYWPEDDDREFGATRTIVEIDRDTQSVVYEYKDGQTRIRVRCDFDTFEEDAEPVPVEYIYNAEHGYVRGVTPLDTPRATPEPEEQPYGYGDDWHKTNAKLHPFDAADIERMLTEAESETAVENGSQPDNRDVTVTFTMTVEQARTFYMDSCKLYHNDFSVIGRLVDAADHISNIVFMALDEMGVKWPDRLFSEDAPYGITADDDDEDFGSGGEDDEGDFGYGFVGV